MARRSSEIGALWHCRFRLNVSARTEACLVFLRLHSHRLVAYKGGKTKCEKAEDRINGLFVLYIKEL